MTKQKVETDGPRASLAAAIESARDAEAHCKALRGSIARIEDERFEARQGLDLAAAREANEPKGNGEVIDRLLAGEGSTALLEPPVDHKAKAEAEQTIVACGRALALLRAELSGAEQSLELRTRRVRDAAGAVVATEALDGLVAEAEQLRAQLEAKLSVLSYLHSQIPREHVAKIERALSSSHAHGAHPAINPWQMTLAALMADATADLPR